jgi:DNA-binding NtrC family response regulator
MGTVLVVEDQSAVRYALRVLFRAHGLAVEEAVTAEAAEARVLEGGIDLVVQDMNFVSGATSGEEGIALFHRLRAIDRDLPIVLLTAWASLDTAVRLAKAGAVDYVAKPWSDEHLVATVRAHLGVRELEGTRSETSPGRGVPRGADTCGVVYRSQAMHKVLSLALQVARENVSILILGPNGVGKQKVAEVIQRNSARSAAPFVRVDAGALPESLLEAELFGAEAGAFTGASKARAGRFEAADGGTLFLDEIGNLSLAGQKRLLRVLQSGEFERLGSSRTKKVDVRLLSATNVDVYAAVQSGAFREDLLYRINVVELRVPPLAERPEDILPIARATLEELARERGTRPLDLSLPAVAALERHAWPGNVRELRNALQRAVVLARGPAVEEEHLALPEPRPSPPRRSGDRTPEPTREAVEAALRRHDGRVRPVAAELGLSRQALYRRIEKLGIAVDAFRPERGDEDD